MKKEKRINRWEKFFDLQYCKGKNCIVKDDCAFHLSNSRKHEIIVKVDLSEEPCPHFSSATLMESLMDIFEPDGVDDGKKAN